MHSIAVRLLEDIEVLVELARDAEQDGHRMVSHLVSEWRDGTNRYAKSGESLYVATLGEEVVGVCGLNIDPYLSDPVIGRVRRLYVAVAKRRSHIGSVLVDRIVEDAGANFDILRLRTFNPVAAAFYVSRGFAEVAGDGTCTHRMDLTAG